VLLLDCAFILSAGRCRKIFGLILKKRLCETAIFSFPPFFFKNTPDFEPFSAVFGLN